MDGDLFGDACDECPNIGSASDCSPAPFDPDTGCCGSAFTGGDEPNSTESGSSIINNKLVKASIAPNPISGGQPLTLSLACYEAVNLLNVQVFDMFGKRVFSTELSGLPKGISTHNLELPPSLTPGVYSLKVQEKGHQIATFKVLKL